MHADHVAHAMNFDWVSVALSLMFVGGAFFYIFRLFSPTRLRAVNGYYDGENEFWHGACMLGMVACLTPAWLPVPVIVWLVGFAIGTGWYVVRALTYGRRLTHNKQWYDWAHAAMMFGMWWMFAQPVSNLFITVAFAAYWTWFGSYYVYRLTLDFKKPTLLGFGQDGAHLLMSVVMLFMTVLPSAFAGHQEHNGGHQQYNGGHHEHHSLVPASEIHSVSAGTRAEAKMTATVIGDDQFDAQVVKRSGTVVVLVSGGCVNCATEIPVFDGVAAKMHARSTARNVPSNTHFVRLLKDKSPIACAWLNAKDCPAVIIVKDGQIVDRLDGCADHATLERFLLRHAR